MLRLSPPGFERLLQSSSLVATFGGGEANVAVSLAQFGLDSWYVTRLPKNPIGDAAIRVLRAEGVRTDAIARGGDRVGIYFAESGASQRASVVVYDRAKSAISEMTPGTHRLGEGVRRRGVVPCHGHHTRARRQCGGVHRRSDCGRQTGRREDQRRPELPQEVMDRSRRATGDAADDGECRRRHRQRRRHPVRARPQRGECRRGWRASRRQRLSDGRGTHHARARALNGGHHAPRKPVGQRQRLERGVVGRQGESVSPEPAIRSAPGRSHRRRRQLRGRFDLWIGDAAAPLPTAFALRWRPAR